MKKIIQDFSVSASVAGFVAVLVGFTSSVAIVFQAATQLGASSAQIASWMWALGIAMGVASALPSWWLRKPVMVAWSTPGAAVLAVAGATGNYTLAQGVGAFIICGLLTLIVGLTGWFDAIIKRIPVAIANALLAGVLAKFGLQAFGMLQANPSLVISMLLVYWIVKQIAPRWAITTSLVVAIVMVFFQGQLNLQNLQWQLAVPQAVWPEFSFAAFMGLALPLWIVTMASQNLPGVAAINACGYGGEKGIPVSKIISLTGLFTLVLAPFGCFSVNLSAITAAICMGPEAHEDPKKRYVAAIVCGVIYIGIGIFGATVALVLAAFPTVLIVVIAGLALLATIGNSLASALENNLHREAALVTFLVCLSGITLLGVGSAFWGVVAGLFAMYLPKVFSSFKKPA